MERSANPAARDHRNVTTEQKRQLGVRFLDYRGAGTTQVARISGHPAIGNRSYRDSSMVRLRYRGIQHV